MHDGAGHKTTTIRLRPQSEEEGIPGPELEKWRPMSLPAMDWARAQGAGWGAQIVGAGGGWRYQMEVLGEGVNAEVIASAWAAARAAYETKEQDSHVCEVKSRPVCEMQDEVWCGEIEALQGGKEPEWWIRPEGMVKRAVMARSVEQGSASGATKRFASPISQVFYLLEMARFRGDPEIAVRWYEGEHEVAARQMAVSGGSVLWGSLTASGGAGLTAGWYAVEIWSGAGKEARLEFLIEPAARP